ncbi:hypothetical protein DPMN_156254 [Dreissena polymorpha]|uniref:Uncharacterized protein n=1 Tax=Dreissena polymorpha TaxID=45954 RepID=A0A9D4FQX0_DREPO|nr:hypothetical protein DPMN_156254 [Dreissena polymorpha]
MQMSMVVMFMTVVVRDVAQNSGMLLISVVMMLIVTLLVLMSVVVMQESVVVMLKPMIVIPMPTVVIMMMLASDVGGVYDSHSVNNDACGAGDGDVIDDAYKSCCAFWCL